MIQNLKKQYVKKEGQKYNSLSHRVLNLSQVCFFLITSTNLSGMWTVEGVKVFFYRINEQSGNDNSFLIDKIIAAYNNEIYYLCFSSTRCQCPDTAHYTTMRILMKHSVKKTEINPMLLAGLYWHLDYLKVFNTTFLCYRAVTTRFYFAAT